MELATYAPYVARASGQLVPRQVPLGVCMMARANPGIERGRPIRLAVMGGAGALASRSISDCQDERSPPRPAVELPDPLKLADCILPPDPEI